ncbi:hypothetical protein M413DRAFT_447129 [Hebeloma cylindrosporum]|uniref:Fungal lipase-like domain-containing protein n=1 Tax=Hebeloma cylindrosporum TaxID=76867 RepID=A0A0C3BSN1_HEBCY|nr:hypothetical protein M413DRAFT_447129 [Hebeloma cylindrosporum h7]
MPRLSPFFHVLGALPFALQGQANPLRRQTASISALSNSQISAFEPFSFYASAAYCQPSAILSWSCGPTCDSNPNFEPVASGGDGVGVQFWYVGYDPSLETIIVGHQGTDPSKIVPLVTDSDIFLSGLDPALFPGISPSIKVHSGFAEEHAKTATSVLSAVKAAMQESGLNKVTMVGHSLGNRPTSSLTLSLICFQALHFRFWRAFTCPSSCLALHSGWSVTVCLGSETKLSRRSSTAAMSKLITSITSEYYVHLHLPLNEASVYLYEYEFREDVVPILPGRFLGFHHPRGEKHIQDDLSWLDCPGEDNPDKRCSTGDVSNIFKGKVSDHNGPYDGVTMGCLP